MSIQEEPVATPLDPKDEPWVAPILRDTLALREASLVLCRRKLIIEFKTENLGRGLQHFVEEGFSTWQVGEFRDHHCHLDLKGIQKIVFDATPVSCQGGKLNYTIWFLVEWECGNPYREGGYFSVTLNSPYQADGSEDWRAIDPVLALFRKYQDHPQVEAEAPFRQAMEARHSTAKEA